LRWAPGGAGWGFWGGGGSNSDTGSDIVLLLATSTLALMFAEHLCNEYELAVAIRPFGNVTE